MIKTKWRNKKKKFHENLGLRDELEVKVAKPFKEKEVKDYEELEEDFVLVAVEVPDKIRFKRAMSRGREDDSMDLDKIKERDKRERNWGIDAVIASADIVISNDGTLEELHDKIRRVFDKF